MGLWGPWGPRGRARRARRPFSSDVPHRLEQPTPPYEPYYVPHEPHGVRRVVLAGREARADPGGAPARARPARRPSEGSALVPRDTDGFILVFTPPVKHTKSTPSRAGAPVRGAVVPSEHQWVTQRSHSSSERAFMDGKRRADRLSAATDPCHSAVGGAAAHGPCAACAALARLWRRTSAPRDRPTRQPHTAPHRPADASRSVSIAGGEIELALLRATVQGTLPASCKARCARCARRDCPGASLGGATPLR